MSVSAYPRKLDQMKFYEQKILSPKAQTLFCLTQIFEQTQQYSFTRSILFESDTINFASCSISNWWTSFRMYFNALVCALWCVCVCTCALACTMHACSTMRWPKYLYVCPCEWKHTMNKCMNQSKKRDEKHTHTRLWHSFDALPLGLFVNNCLCIRWIDTLFYLEKV